MNIQYKIRPALLVLALAGAAPAFAGTLPLSYSMTTAGTVTSGITSNLAVPGSYTYDHSFTAPAAIIPGTSYSFYDDFVFTISGAVASSITSTINLGSILEISNLQARLYKPESGETLPVLGRPINGAIDAWSVGIAPGLGSIEVISAAALSAGTYVLELRGVVTGSSGGSYAGVLNVAQVPVPAAAWLFFSALGGLASLRRRLTAA